MEQPDDFVARIGKLDWFEGSDTGRLLGMITALAGEVFVLKAEVERLRRALDAGGVVGADQLASAGESAAMRAWLAEEERTFGAQIYGPFLAPDLVVNASAGMRES